MVERVLPSRPYDVLFSMPWAGPSLDGSGPAGGAETQILGVARGLASAGLSVAVLVVGERSRLPREVDGVRVLTQAKAPAVRGLGGLLHDLRTLYALVRSPARVVVKRNASRSVAVAALAARLRRASFVYSSANVVDFDLGRLEQSINVRLFEWGARAAAELVVQTDEQADLCRARFGRDPVVIRSIAERAEPRSLPPEAFLWIGRLASYKQPEAYLDLAEAVPEATFRMVGVPTEPDGPRLAAALAERAASLPNIELLDPRPRPQLVPLVERAVAIVNTSEYEGMPNVFLEGWSRGVPALAFSHDPDGVVSRHGLGSFAGGSPERLAELARECWATRSDQREVAARCIGYVRRHHDFDAVCEAWRATIAAAARD
jgi:glycosyltransferase involved in cell wall biosynthesis